MPRSCVSVRACVCGVSVSEFVFVSMCRACVLVRARVSGFSLLMDAVTGGFQDKVKTETLALNPSNKKGARVPICPLARPAPCPRPPDGASDPP